MVWVLVFTLTVTGKLPFIVEHTEDISGIFYGSKAECQTVAYTLWQNMTWMDKGLRMAVTKVAECKQQKRTTS